MRSDFDIAAIQAFVAIVDEGSMAGAARRLGLTRSAMGKALARLEARLDVRLLNRTTRRITVTDEGLRFHESCTRILADLAEAEASVRREQDKPMGTLRLALPEAYGRLRVLPVVQDYLRTWPELKAEISFTDRVIDMTEEGYDLAVRIGDVASDPRLLTRVIDRFHTVICASPEYLSRYGTPDAPEDLADRARLSFGKRGTTIDWRLRTQAGRDITLPGSARFVFDSAEAIRDAAVAGLGIAYLPDFLVQPALTSGQLVRLLPDVITQQIAVHLVYPDRRHLPARSRAFIDLMVNRNKTG
ncbi:LysR family transcriptional regulator [Roseinatronobacter sp. S2]|uniref:LysR family transcriptional regulator n=1 Tax=Roseinatronobacter sp. S2 TaxID=3035471 RepID=UPI00240F0C2D|nr:LysR family transcriptional regulator [Roseinatronobacter sp. S2]WFE76539.1 LysR family transcriptional regulator [Roseinatronobacter sp. S2]